MMAKDLAHNDPGQLPDREAEKVAHRERGGVVEVKGEN
jgi:hypothetical protein